MKKLMALVLFLGCVTRAMSGDIYVSPNGNDRNDGTVARPLQTLHQALRQAREWRRLGSRETVGGIRILMEGGTYRLDRTVMLRPEDSGTADSPTVIMRRPDSGPVYFSGGIELSGWKQGTDNPHIPSKVRSQVWTAEVPLVGGRPMMVRQLFASQSKSGRSLCRATQFGFISQGRADGRMLRMERIVGFNPVTRTITIPTPAFPCNPVPNGLEMMVHQRWATAILRVKDMRVMGDTTVVSFHEPESTLEFEHPWPQPVIGGERGNSSFTLMNTLELLDEAGEWVQEWPTGRIYWLRDENGNRASENMKTENAIVAPVLKTLVEVAGSQERRVHDIHFDGITFCHTAWTRPAEQGHVTLQGGFAIVDAYKLQTPGLPEKAELENQAWIERPDAAVRVSYAHDLSFRRCEFTDLGATGLDLRQCVRQTTVDGCEFSRIGGTALLIGTFPDGGFETHVPYRPLHDELCDDITISHNRIAECTVEDWGAVGIGAGYVSNVSIVQNEVCHVNYSGICVGWGWTPLESGMHDNHIEGNDIHDYACQLYDAGGIYTLSNQPGSTIRGNHIAAPSAAPYATNHRAFCIYFDEATDGFTVEDNDMDAGSVGWNKPGPNMVLRRNGRTTK